MAQAVERIVNGVKARNLHGKDYVEVAERVRVAHAVSDDIEMVESGPYQVADRWLWKVVIKVNGHQYIGNAEIKLNAPKNTPDGTNPFECAETSAAGRAFGFAGLGTVDSIASYDEIIRGKPASTRVIEQPQTEIVSQLHAAPPREIELFLAGKELGLWNVKEQFINELSKKLGVTLAPDGKLTIDQRLTIAQMIEEAKEELLVDAEQPAS